MARILIIEDSDDFRRLLQARLEMEGFEVSVAANGEAALQAMARRPADVVLTDVFMPDKDGLETIAEMRVRYPSAKLVAMSGWRSPQGVDYLNVAREIGAAHVVRKPFDVDKMVEVLRQLARETT